MTTRTLMSALLCTTFAAALAGCASNGRSADEGYYTSSSTNNRVCPVCGMDANPQYTAWQDGKEVACCSQACEDTFNNASASEKRTMWNRAYGNSVAPSVSIVTPDTAPVATPLRGTTNTVMYNGQEYPQENKVCVITGRQVDGTHYVIADGHRVDFATQAAADKFATMNYEQRTEARLAAR